MVTEALANEVIVLRLKAVTVDEAMKRIASTVGAEWHTADAGFELVRPDELAAKLRKEGLEAKAAAIAKMIEQQKKLAGGGDPLTTDGATLLAAHYDQSSNLPNTGNPESYQAYRRAQESLPDNRAAWKVLSAIDPKAIAGMESGQRVVFSNHPTAMQLPIDGDLTSIGDQMLQDHNMLADAFKKLRKPDPNKQAVPFYGQDPSVQMDGPPVRFVVSLQLMFLSQSYMVEMIGFDAKNNAICLSNVSLNVMGDQNDLMAQRTRVARANESEAKLPVSPLTQSMLDYMKKSMGNGGGSGMEPATGELRSALLNPDRTDPLAYIFSEAFLGIANLRNENLVAYPDDSAFLLGMFAGMEGQLKPSLVMQAVTGLGPMVPTNVTEQDGWLTIRPAHVLETVQTRTSRPALGEFLREFDQKGYLTLDSVGTLAAAVNGREFPVLDMFLPMMVDPAGADLHQSGDFNMLKLYGSLDESQLTRLNSHKSIRLAELRPEQAALLSRYVYESSRGFGGAPMVRDKSYAQSSADKEPTEAIPGGLSNDTTLTMSSTDAKVYFVKIGFEAGGSYTSPMSLDSLAWTIYTKSHPENSPGYNPNILGISPGTERTIQVVIGISPKNQPQCELKEHRPAPGGPWALDKLPDDVKKELDKAVARLTQMYQQQPGQDDGASPATPPVPVAPPSR